MNYRTVAFAAILCPVLASAQPDYAKAERMLTWNTAPLVANDVVSVTWLTDSVRFWYRVTRPGGSEFVLVDPLANTQRPLFDHRRLAAAITMMEASSKAYEPTKLPFQTFTLLNGDHSIRFAESGRWIECNLDTYACVRSTFTPLPARSSTVCRSPSRAAASSTG